MWDRRLLLVLVLVLLLLHGLLLQPSACRLVSLALHIAGIGERLFFGHKKLIV